MSDRRSARVTAMLFELPVRSLMQFTCIRIRSVWSRSEKTLNSPLMAEEETADLCEFWGRNRKKKKRKNLGDFQLRHERRPSAVPPYWRGYDGVRSGAAGQRSGTAEIASSRARSWNTTPRLLTLLPPLSLVSLAFSPLFFTLPLFKLRSCYFFLVNWPPSIHPFPDSLPSLLPSGSSHSSCTSSGARQRGYGFIWISECTSASPALGRGIVLRLHSCGGVMGPSAQGSLS